MQHHRQGSNTSLDSASHYIDHRSQQLPMPSISSSGPRLAGRRSQNRMEPAASDLGQRRRRVSNLDSSAVEDESMGMHVDEARGAVSQQDRATATNSASNAAGGARGVRERLIDLGGEDEEDDSGGRGDTGHLTDLTSRTPNTMSRRNSLQDDVCFPMVHPADGNAAEDDGMLGDPAHYENMHPHDAHADHTHADGRQEQLPPGFPWTFDLGALEDFASVERKRVEEEATAAANVATSYGLRHRNQSNGANRDIKRRSVNDRRSMPGSYGMSPDSDDATFYSRRPRKFINVPGLGPDVADGGKTNAASSRYQRKLALFEGAGSTPPPIGARSATFAGKASGGSIMGNGALMDQDRLDEQERHQRQARTSNGYPADTKTPLLEGGQDTGLPSYQGTADWAADQEGELPNLNRSQSAGADLNNLIKNKKSKRPGRGARSGSYNNDRQYRFTFYSNALPNTIHARHLYELPAPGQSFEELFMGQEPGGYKPNESPAAEETAAETPADAATDRAAADSRPRSNLATALHGGGRMESDTAPPTGSNTPELVAPAPFRAMGPGQARLAQMNPARNSTNLTSSNEKARAMPGGGIRMDQDPEMSTWWLDVLCPTDQEMKMLSRVFGIHPLTTEDILMEETREKIELFRNYYLVCFRSFDQDPYSPTYLEPLNMYVIVFREGTLSFHFRATPHPQNVRRRIKQLKDYINVTSDWISYALIDDITDAFGPLIQSIEYEVDSIDELVLILKEAEQSDMLRRIGTCRKKVMGLLRLMGNKADVVKGLAKRCNENWSVAPKSDIGLYLSDIQDHLITMTQNLNHYEKILSRSHSNCELHRGRRVQNEQTLTASTLSKQTWRKFRLK
jgi:magnesium transporter